MVIGSYISYYVNRLNTPTKTHRLAGWMKTCVCMHFQVLSHFSCIRLFETLCPVAQDRLLCPWDSPGRNTGVGCRALLQGNLPEPGIETVSPVVPALQAEPSQNPAWDLNPRGWDSNLAKTHGTWFQDLMKLGFLMSHRRKNSVRDKVTGKKWIYSDTERSTLQRQSRGHHKYFRKLINFCLAKKIMTFLIPLV